MKTNRAETEHPHPGPLSSTSERAPFAVPGWPLKFRTPRLLVAAIVSPLLWGVIIAPADGSSGATYGDSADFLLNTTGLSSLGGATYADSANFGLNTTGFSSLGGSTYGDSTDFTLNTGVPFLINSRYVSGHFSVNVTGQAGDVYVLETSSNLAGGIWSTIYTNTAPFAFTNNVEGDPTRFYRAVLQQ